MTLSGAAVFSISYFGPQPQASKSRVVPTIYMQCCSTHFEHCILVCSASQLLSNIGDNVFVREVEIMYSVCVCDTDTQDYMWATSVGGVVVETACSTSFVLYFNPSLRHWWLASILLAHCGAILDILARQLGLKGPRLASIDHNAIFHILTDCPLLPFLHNKPSAQNQCNAKQRENAKRKLV